MENEVKLAAGAMVALGVATAALVVLPCFQVRDIKPPEGLKPYTSAELRGRNVYIANGCVYCHTQQPRDRNLGPDHLRGWGRPSVPGASGAKSPPSCLMTPTFSPRPRRMGSSFSSRVVFPLPCTPLTASTAGRFSSS